MNDYPACISAVYISEVVPSNSTVCEQGFSVTTLLQSNLQAKLSTEKLDDKLRIYFAFRKYGHDDALFKSLDIPNLDALVQEWYETTPESTLSCGSEEPFQAQVCCEQDAAAHEEVASG